MSNLFSIFDPVTFFSLPLNWLATLFTLISLPTMFWLLRSQMITFFVLILQFIYSEFFAITSYTFTPGGIFLCLSLFLFIVLNNFFGLFPYIFTASSHLSFTVTLALPLWIGHMAMSWLKSTETMCAHLVPVGTPYALMPFMVLIESVSNIIRPLTLSVRLAANMVAGHLLLTLLSSQCSHVTPMIVLLLIVALTLLATLESAVALIQAYVFSVLSTLYVAEVSSPNLSN